MKKIPITEDFETILICAVRYAIGRQTYMPSIVIGYIRPLIGELNTNTLRVMERDVREAGYYGHETIDKPDWVRFLKNLQEEMKRRRAGDA